MNTLMQPSASNGTRLAYAGTRTLSTADSSQMADGVDFKSENVEGAVPTTAQDFLASTDTSTLSSIPEINAPKTDLSKADTEEIKNVLSQLNVNDASPYSEFDFATDDFFNLLIALRQLGMEIHNSQAIASSNLATIAAESAKNASVSIREQGANALNGAIATATLSGGLALASCASSLKGIGKELEAGKINNDLLKNEVDFDSKLKSLSLKMEDLDKQALGKAKKSYDVAVDTELNSKERESLRNELFQERIELKAKFDVHSTERTELVNARSAKQEKAAELTRTADKLKLAGTTGLQLLGIVNSTVNGVTEQAKLFHSADQQIFGSVQTVSEKASETSSGAAKQSLDFVAQMEQLMSRYTSEQINAGSAIIQNIRY